jgi:hypothetical protein
MWLKQSSYRFFTTQHGQIGSAQILSACGRAADCSSCEGELLRALEPSGGLACPCVHVNFLTAKPTLSAPLLPPSTRLLDSFHSLVFNRKYGLHRLHLRRWPHPPEQLGQDPQLHCWVSCYPAMNFQCAFLPTSTLPKSNDENIWSVLMRRLKTPLSEYKTKRLRNSD